MNTRGYIGGLFLGDSTSMDDASSLDERLSFSGRGNRQISPSTDLRENSICQC